MSRASPLRRRSAPAAALPRLETAARLGFAAWRAVMVAAVLGLFFIAFAGPVFARPQPPSVGAASADRAAIAALCRAATDRAEGRHGTPPGLMRALSLVESGRSVRGVRAAWPWTVNLEGDGHYFDTRAEALAFVRAALAEGRTSFDVGCMQVNYRWHGRHFASLEEMFDPMANADYAARFLVALKQETGDWMHAAGYYHSRTPELATRYRRLVAAAHADVGAAPPAAVAALAPPPRAADPAPSPEPPPPNRRASWPSLEAGAPLVALPPRRDAPRRPTIAAASPPEGGGGLLLPVKPLF